MANFEKLGQKIGSKMDRGFTKAKEVICDFAHNHPYATIAVVCVTGSTVAQALDPERMKEKNGERKFLKDVNKTLKQDIKNLRPGEKIVVSRRIENIEK